MYPFNYCFLLRYTVPALNKTILVLCIKLLRECIVEHLLGSPMYMKSVCEARFKQGNMNLLLYSMFNLFCIAYEIHKLEVPFTKESKNRRTGHRTGRLTLKHTELAGLVLPVWCSTRPCSSHLYLNSMHISLTNPSVFIHVEVLFEFSLF